MGRLFRMRPRSSFGDFGEDHLSSGPRLRRCSVVEMQHQPDYAGQPIADGRTLDFHGRTVINRGRECNRQCGV